MQSPAILVNLLNLHFLCFSRKEERAKADIMGTSTLDCTGG
jgi:hypothetical protein